MKPAMYAKIFQKIHDSSIAENYEIRFVFMDLLILSNRDGIVDMTHEAIARRTNVPITIVRASIIALESPDENSRSATDDGRRIERLDDHRDWGWRIINFSRYRDLKTSEQLLEQNRVRVRRHRAKQAGEPFLPPDESEPKPKDGMPPIPTTLNTPRFQAAWSDWLDDRKARKKTVTARGAKAQLEKLAEIGEGRALAAIAHSIASGYQGIYEQGSQNGRRSGAEINKRNEGTIVNPVNNYGSFARDKAAKGLARNLARSTEGPSQGAGGA